MHFCTFFLYYNIFCTFTHICFLYPSFLLITFYKFPYLSLYYSYTFLLHYHISGTYLYDSYTFHLQCPLSCTFSLTSKLFSHTHSMLFITFRYYSYTFHIQYFLHFPTHFIAIPIHIPCYLSHFLHISALFLHIPYSLFLAPFHSLHNNYSCMFIIISLQFTAFPEHVFCFWRCIHWFSRNYIVKFFLFHHTEF